jgi:hypothetical protein
VTRDRYDLLLPDAAERLAIGVGDLVGHFGTSPHHGLFRGSAEDAIVAAQGALMLAANGAPINHTQSVIESAGMLSNAQSPIIQALSYIKKADLIAWSRVSEALSPLLEYSFSLKNSLSGAIKLTQAINPDENVKTRFNSRLDGLVLETGERNYRNLISVQIHRKKYLEFFKSKNIQPTIFPFFDDNVRGLEKSLSKLPINQRDINERMAPMMNVLDSETGRSTISGFGRGAPALEIIYAALRTKL